MGTKDGIVVCLDSMSEFKSLEAKKLLISYSLKMCSQKTACRTSELKGWRVTIENVKGRCSMEILLELFGKVDFLVSLFSYTID
jgi:hypothetical protein